MRLKKVVALSLATLLVSGLALTGCGAKETAKTDTDKNATSGEKMHVEIIAKGFQHDFWQAVLQGTEKAAKDFNVTTNFVGPETESDIADQVEMLNNAINKKPAAIALASLDTSAAIDAIANAQAQGVPIIGFDSGVPGAPEGAVHANASTDNYAAGALAADNMFEAIKDKVASPSSTVRIGVVAQDAVSESISNRTAGFVERLAELIGNDKVSIEGHDRYKKEVSGASIVIEVRIPATVDDNSGKTEALTLLNKEDLIAIYGSNEFAAKSIINANEGMNKLGADKVIAVGFDSGALQLEAIRTGVFYGSVTQDPVSIGYKAVELAVKAAKGETVSNVDTGALWYNAGNMESAEIAPCLYE